MAVTISPPTLLEQEAVIEPKIVGESFTVTWRDAGKNSLFIIRLWAKRYLGDKVSVTYDKGRDVYQFEAEDGRVGASIPAFLSQLKENGYPDRKYWV